MTTPIDVRFWRRVNKQGPVVRPELGNCWLWTGCVTSRRYGSIGLGPPAPRNSAVSTHVLSWKLAHPGEEIPAGQVVRHKCDVRRCVNPDHLKLGTHLDNSHDAIERKRLRVGESNHSSKLTEAQVREIRARHDNGESYPVLAAELGLSFEAVRDAGRGRSWSHISIEPRPPDAPRVLTRRRPHNWSRRSDGLPSTNKKAGQR